MSTTMPQPTEFASAATPAPASTPVIAAPAAAAAPAPQKAAPAKRARQPARKVASDVAPAKETAVKKPVVEKVAAKVAAPQKVAAKAPLAKAAVAVNPEKKAALPKVKKDKLIRDSFTIPKAEYAVIDELKQRAAKLNSPVKKSELLRAGIKLLATLSNAALVAALTQVPTIKTGRPSLKK